MLQSVFPMFGNRIGIGFEISITPSAMVGVVVWKEMMTIGDRDARPT
jgi:hypothetical protein